jgi:hypothetical protein
MIVLFRDGLIELVAITSGRIPWMIRVDGYSFQQDFLPPTHLHEFHFTIDYISIYAHDHYVLDLSLLFYIIKHRGRYFDG